jgi:hypothetical protein
MSDPHPARVTRIDLEESERLLDRASADATHAHVAALLAAAAAPAQPAELSAEQAAVDAFTAAYRPAPAPVPSSTRRHTRRAALVALTAVSASLVAGTAYAARAGHLPEPLQRGAHSLFSGIGVPAPAAPRPTRSSTGVVATRPPTPPRPTDTAGSQHLLALCRTWVAIQNDPHAGPLTATQRHDLAVAAGGEPEITTYCRQLLQPTPAPTTYSTATKPGNPSPGRKPSHPVKPSHP